MGCAYGHWAHCSCEINGRYPHHERNKEESKEVQKLLKSEIPECLLTLRASSTLKPRMPAALCTSFDKSRRLAILALSFRPCTVGSDYGSRRATGGALLEIRKGWQTQWSTMHLGLPLLDCSPNPDSNNTEETTPLAIQPETSGRESPRREPLPPLNRSRSQGASQCTSTSASTEAHEQPTTKQTTD